MAAVPGPSGRGRTGRRSAINRRVDRLRALFDRGRKKHEKASELLDKAGSVQESASETIERLATAREAFGDPVTFVQGLAPSALGRFGGIPRSRWVILGTAWAGFLGATPWLADKAGTTAEAVQAAASQPSEATEAVLEGLDGIVSPIRESVESLAGAIQSGEVSRLALQDRLREAGRSLEGLVDLTVAYEPFASPVGTKLDAPSYLVKEDRLVQRESEVDYAQASGDAAPWFETPKQRGGPGWSMAGAAAAAGLHFGMPFGSDPGRSFDGVVNATISVEPIARQMDELAESGGEDGVQRLYLLGPDGEVLHRADADSSGFAGSLSSLFDGGGDALDAEISRFGSRILSGEPGQFPLGQAGSLIERGRQLLEPGWVEHVPLPGTEWAIAVAYEGEKDDKAQSREVRSEATGLGVFAGLMVATVVAGVAGAASTKGGKSPPTAGLFRSSDLDYPNAPASSGGPAAMIASGGVLDGFLRQVLNQGGRRNPQTAGSALTSARGSSGGSESANEALAGSPAPAQQAPAVAANAPAADFPVEIQEIPQNPPIAANLVPTLFKPGGTDQITIPPTFESIRSSPPLDGLSDRFSLEQLNRDTYGGLGAFGGGAGGLPPLRGFDPVQLSAPGFIDQSLSQVYDPKAVPAGPPAPTIPEPATWLLATLGLALAVVVARRRSCAKPN